MNQAAIDRLIAAGRLKRVPPDMPRARILLVQAETHLRSADEISTTDAALSYVALYDAARKAIVAHMLSNGYRETVRPGAHKTVVEYAQASFTDVGMANSLLRLDRVRRNRNRTEYESWEPSLAAISSDLVHARAIVESIRQELAF